MFVVTLYQIDHYGIQIAELAVLVAAHLVNCFLPWQYNVPAFYVPTLLMMLWLLMTPYQLLFFL